MTTRRIRGAPGALALLTLVALCLAAPARAVDPAADGDSEDGWKKVIAYARCAFYVFLAGDPISSSVAFFDCARTYLNEPPMPAGGGS